jgi:adenylate cyclase
MWAYTANALVRAERGDAATEPVVRSAISYCRERGIPFWEPVCLWSLAYYLVRTSGKYAEGLALARQALADHQATGSRTNVSMMLSTIAQGCLGIGALEDAAAAIRSGLENARATDNHFGEPELHRMAAELALAGPAPDEREAEAHFVKAIDCGRQYDQKLSVLRAVTGLARLWQHQGRQDEAKRLLEKTYSTFSEALDTFDLATARRLLEGMT